MAKLYQHQTDGTYYTRLLLRDNNKAGIVTRQIHPDGVAYLKHCGVRVGSEIPSNCVTVLWDYEWLHTKDEVPYWGEVNWAPRWTTITPRPLHELRPYRGTPSRACSTGVDHGMSAPSAADQFLAEVREMQARAAREREQRMDQLIAEIDAKQRATRERRARERTARERESAAKRAAEQRQREAEPQRQALVGEEHTRKRREAAEKDAYTRRRNAERSEAAKAAVPVGATPSAGIGARSMPPDQPLYRSPSTPEATYRTWWSNVGLAAKTIRQEPGKRKLIDPAPASKIASTVSSVPQSASHDDAPGAGTAREDAAATTDNLNIVMHLGSPDGVQPLANGAPPAQHVAAVASSPPVPVRRPRFVVETREEAERRQHPLAPEARWSLNVWIVLCVVVVLLWIREPSLALMLIALVVAFKFTGLVRRILRNLLMDGRYVEP